jgi:hypothetical protein
MYIFIFAIMTKSIDMKNRVLHMCNVTSDEGIRRNSLPSRGRQDTR